MAVKTYVGLYIGRLSDMDPVEGINNTTTTSNGAAENALSTLGNKTFGSNGTPLFAQSTRVMLDDVNGDGSLALNQYNTTETMSYRLGNEIIKAKPDAIVVVSNASVTQRLPDGTFQTITGTVRVAQDVNGNAFILPPRTADSSETAITTYPITSVTFPTRSEDYVSNHKGVTMTRQDLSAFQDGYIDGGDGNDVIDENYTGDLDGDRVDNNDALLPGATGNEDFIRSGLGDDLIYGGAGRDSVRGGGGNDTVYGYGRTTDDGAADTLEGLTGSDQLYGGRGNDVIYGDNFDGTLAEGAADTLDGGSGSDSLVGGAAGDSLIGGTGNDTIYGDDIDGISTVGGADRIDAGDGQDSVVAGIGDDTVTGGLGRDTIFGNDGDDSIAGDDSAGSTLGDADVIDAGAGNDVVTGGAGADTVTGGTGADSVLGGIGDDVIHGDDAAGSDTLGGADTLSGGDGNDNVDGGFGDDLIAGDEGNDSLAGNTGNDTLDGGAGADTLAGGDGDDLLDGGAGQNTLTGGAGRDVFVARDTNTVTDFYAGDDADQRDSIDLSGYYNAENLARWNAAHPDQTYRNPLQWLRADQADGRLDMLDGADGLPTMGMQLENDGTAVEANRLEQSNTSVMCFGADVMIETDRGPVAAGALVVGDLVRTRDAGLQPVRWIGGRSLSAADFDGAPNLRPVRIKAHALGHGLPAADLIVSPQHRVLVRSGIARTLFGADEVLVAAKQLLALDGFEIACDLEAVDYVHFLFDDHQVVISNGAETESLHPGKQALSMMGDAGRAEVLALFPDLADADHVRPTARIVAPGRQARTLAARHAEDARPLVA